MSLVLLEPHVWLTTVKDAMLDACPIARELAVNVKVNLTLFSIHIISDTQRVMPADIDI